MADRKIVSATATATAVPSRVRPGIVPRRSSATGPSAMSGRAWHGRGEWYATVAPPSPWRQLEADDPDAIAMDNRTVPLTVASLAARSGQLAGLGQPQRPLVAGPDYLSCLGTDRRRFEVAADNGQPDAFLLVDTHPYDMQDPSTGDVSTERVDAYSRSLEWVTETFRAEAIRLDQVEGFCPRESRGCYEDRHRCRLGRVRSQARPDRAPKSPWACGA